MAPGPPGGPSGGANFPAGRPRASRGGRSAEPAGAPPGRIPTARLRPSKDAPQSAAAPGGDGQVAVPRRRVAGLQLGPRGLAALAGGALALWRARLDSDAQPSAARDACWRPARPPSRRGGLQLPGLGRAPVPQCPPAPRLPPTPFVPALPCSPASPSARPPAFLAAAAPRPPRPPQPMAPGGARSVASRALSDVALEARAGGRAGRAECGRSLAPSPRRRTPNSARRLTAALERGAPGCGEAEAKRGRAPAPRSRGNAASAAGARRAGGSRQAGRQAASERGRERERGREGGRAPRAPARRPPPPHPHTHCARPEGPRPPLCARPLASQGAPRPRSPRAWLPRRPGRRSAVRPLASAPGNGHSRRRDSLSGKWAVARRTGGSPVPTRRCASAKARAEGRAAALARSPSARPPALASVDGRRGESPKSVNSRRGALLDPASGSSRPASQRGQPPGRKDRPWQESEPQTAWALPSPDLSQVWHATGRPSRSPTPSLFCIYPSSTEGFSAIAMSAIPTHKQERFGRCAEGKQTRCRERTASHLRPGKRTTAKESIKHTKKIIICKSTLTCTIPPKIAGDMASILSQPQIPLECVAHSTNKSKRHFRIPDSPFLPVLAKWNLLI
ncbi:uncharacterized protein LOC143838869 [Paroedura picta]|uniref:uncharacterized protein LOC143838869 n=1 Tax=Paroedura picta TaxID=143630 RepID=UPI0040579FC2